MTNEELIEKLQKFSSHAEVKFGTDEDYYNGILDIKYEYGEIIIELIDPQERE